MSATRLARARITHTGAVVGHIRAGLFPRDMTLAADGTLLVSDFDSGQVEAVDVATIAGTPGDAGLTGRSAPPTARAAGGVP